MELDISAEENLSSRVLQVPNLVGLVVLVVSQVHNSTSGHLLLASIIHHGIRQTAKDAIGDEASLHTVEYFIRSQAVVGSSRKVIPQEDSVDDGMGPVVAG